MEITNQIKVLDFRKYRGRVFVTTDIHGHFDILHEKLREVAFDSSKDKLIVCGDLCDRGPDSKYVLDYLNESWFYCIRGNHEELFLAAYDEEYRGPATNCLLSNGGIWVADLTDEERKNIYCSFASLPVAFEVITDKEVIGIVHAQCPYNNWDEFKKMSKRELEFNGLATLQWARSNYDRDWQETVKGVDRLLVGHTPTDTGDIDIKGNTWYLDAGSFFRGKINFIQIV